MYTQCPECETAFRITIEQIRVGQGKVQCSKCDTLFDSISTLSDIAFENRPVNIRQVPTLPFEQALSSPKQDEPPEDSEIPTRMRARSKPQPTSIRVGWLAGCTLMVGLLIAQITVMEGHNLVQKPNLRPWFEEFCKTMHCKLPLYREPSAIDVLEQGLHAKGADRLEFRLVIVNASKIQQAFPRLKLSLTKFNGDPLAERVFYSKDYNSDSDLPTRMSVGKPFEIRLELLSPESEIGGYHFSLI